MYLNNDCHQLKLEKVISNICNYEYEYFFNKPNVIGVGCGYKIKNGFRTCNLCIQVFVKNKISKSLLSKNQLIPNCYKNISTDVIETGEAFTCSLKDRIRPVLGGYGISVNEKNLYGSTCCLVSNGVSNFILGTNHILAGENQFPLDSEIIQPSYLYGGRVPNDKIATLSKYIPVRPIEGRHEPINLTDCALGLLTKRNILSPEIALIGRLKGVKKSVKLNDEVKKVGATSELTYGVVNSIHATARIIFNSRNRYLFQDLIFTSSMCQPGDSGSILVNKNNYAVGMVFSFNNTFSFSCYLSTVLDQLDVNLVT